MSLPCQPYTPGAVCIAQAYLSEESSPDDPLRVINLLII
jgi:hypothetical protein